jgi:lipid-A-disaccharide synthase
VEDARAALHHARVSVVASGTATVEAALIGNPFVVVYRVSPLTYAIAKRVVTVPHVAMANLIAGNRVVPELIQQRVHGGKYRPTNRVAATRRAASGVHDGGAPRGWAACCASRQEVNLGRAMAAIDRVAAVTLEFFGAACPVLDHSIVQS